MDKINRERNTCSFIGLGTLACFVGAPFKLVFLTGLNQVGEMKAVLKLRFSHLHISNSHLPVNSYRKCSILPASNCANMREMLSTQETY